jgi:hypothetical protein
MDKKTDAQKDGQRYREMSSDRETDVQRDRDVEK